MSGTAINPPRDPKPKKNSPLAVSVSAKMLAVKMARKKTPIKIEDLDDEDILTALLTSNKAAKVVLAEIGALENFVLLADPAVENRVKASPDVGAAIWVKLECIFECLVRIRSEAT